MGAIGTGIYYSFLGIFSLMAAPFGYTARAEESPDEDGEV